MAVRMYRVRSAHLTRPAVVKAIAAGKLTVLRDNGTRAFCWVRGLTKAQHRTFAGFPGVQPVSRGTLSRRANADALRDELLAEWGDRRMARVMAEHMTEPDPES